MRKINNRSLIKYHRWIGLFTLIFILILAITGLLLQHTDSFGFGHKHLRQSWLLSWYNSPTPEIQSIELKTHHIIQVDQSVLFNQKIIGQSNGRLWGASQTDDSVLIGTGTTIFWLTSAGEMIDSLKPPVSQPRGLINVNQQFKLKTDEGWLAFDEELERWSPNEEWDIPPPQIKQPTISMLDLPTELAVGISIERLLQDLHSGRFFGPVGIFLMDLASFALILLAITGAWVWIRKC